MAKKAAQRKRAGKVRPGSTKGQKRTPSNKRPGAGARASARSGAGSKRVSTAGRNTGRKAVRQGSRQAVRPSSRQAAGAKTAPGKKSRSLDDLRRASERAKDHAAVSAPAQRGAKKKAPPPRDRSAKLRAGGTGLERDLDQTPETGRSVKGPTNPMPTKRSTGTAAGAGNTRRAPGLERARRQLREIEETVPTPPSSLNMDRKPSAARSGRRELREARLEHNEVSPEITAGDVDADWEDAYSVGDEAPGGDNPTPDQDRVDDIGKALGVQYEDNEELKASDKIAERDRKRWELDPASSDDYRDRD
jgi:hypothetical protein